jgi:WD40 repeat protein
MLVLEDNSGPIETMAFHPDGIRLVVKGSSSRGSPAYWDATTAKKLGEWDILPARISGNMCFHPSGQCLFAALIGGELQSVATAHGKVVGMYCMELALAPAADRLIIALGQHFYEAHSLTGDKQPLREWTARQGRGGEVWFTRSVAFFPDSKRFASAEFRESLVAGRETWIRIRAAKDGSVLEKFGCNCGFPQQVAVSPDGTWIALRAGASLLIFHMTNAAKSVKLQSPNRKHLTHIAFHPSGRFLAGTCNDSTVRLHDRDNGWEVTKVFEWDIGKLKAIAFNPTGNLAAAGGESGKVVVWDVDL